MSYNGNSKSKFYYQRLNKRRRKIVLENEWERYNQPIQQSQYPYNYDHSHYQGNSEAQWRNDQIFRSVAGEYWQVPNYNYNYWQMPIWAPPNNYMDELITDLTAECAHITNDKHTVDVKIDLKDIPNKDKQFMVISPPTSIRNLIDIINDNEISEEIEYNIDLKSLSNIKNELIELRDMVGMETLKDSVFKQLIYFIQNLHIGENIDACDFKHTVIVGPPGTGKTKVAKILGNIYAKLGVLKNNIFKKVTRNDLIAGYLGQTTLKTRKVIDDCLGGVIFIDEAYSLSNEDKEDIYAKECLDTLCEALSDHKDKLMVIIAGYENELNNRFFSANKGLESRFIWRFKIEQYTPLELMRIFHSIVMQSEWQMLDDTQINEKWFHEKKDKFQGLGRDMEVLFTYAKMAHSLRIYGKGIELRRKISLEDMNQAYKTFLDNIKKEETSSFMNSIYI